MPRTIKAGLEGHWSRILDDFAVSNCSVSEYCQQLNISKAALYGWSKKLGRLLRSRYPAKEVPIDQKVGQPMTTERKSPFSFIELDVPYPPMDPPLSVKFELLLTQGRSLKIEVSSTWGGIIGLTKALAS